MFIPKLRTFFLVLFVHIMLLSAGQSGTPQWASIKAFLPRWEGANIIITINKNPVYKGKVQSGMVSFNYQLSGTSEAAMEVKNEKTAHLFFFAEPGVIRITDDGRTLRASGTLNNDHYSQLEKDLDSLARIGTNGSEASVKEMKRHKVSDLVRGYPSSIVSLRLLYKYYSGERHAIDTVYYQLFHTLSAEMRATPTGRIMEQEVKKRYKIAIGREAPTLWLPDTKKVMQPVYQKGQYTLIQFWASWCAPCKKMNTTLRDLQKDLPAEVLALVGISVDANYSAWVNAIKNEKLNWKQLNDLKGWTGEMAKSYSVESIPTNILVDPNGIIIARNVSADDLRKLIPASRLKTF